MIVQTWGLNESRDIIAFKERLELKVPRVGL